MRLSHKDFPSTAEFWQPLIFTARDLSSEARGAQWVQVLARLKMGVSAQLATTALQTIGDSLGQAFPDTEKDVTLQASLLLSRAQARGREVAVRIALGAAKPLLER